MRAWIVLGAALLASACNQPAPTYAPEVEFNFMRACEERSEVPGLGRAERFHSVGAIAWAGA